MLLVSPQANQGVDGQEGQDDSASGLSEFECLPEEVSHWVLHHAECILEETTLVSTVNRFFGHLSAILKCIIVL